MSDIRFQPRNTPSAVTADGGYQACQGLRDGSISVADWSQRLLIGGYGYGCSMGSVVTALTFLVTAANRPDAWLRVPSGTTIFPYYVNAALTAMAGTVTMFDLRVAGNDIGNGTSTAATVAPQNLRTDAPHASSVVARQLATADTTAETLPLSIARKTYIRADDAGSDDKGFLYYPQPGLLMPLVGPATLELFVEATTTQATGYVVMQWIEVPSTWVV